MLMLKVTAN